VAYIKQISNTEAGTISLVAVIPPKCVM